MHNSAKFKGLLQSKGLSQHLPEQYSEQAISRSFAYQEHKPLVSAGQTGGLWPVLLSFSSGPWTSSTSPPYSACRPESYKANETAENTALHLLPSQSLGSSPCSFPRAEIQLSRLWPRHTHLYRELNTLKPNKNQCTFWVVHWAFSCGFVCSFGLFPLSLNSILKGFILEWR